ncbi:ABC transporter substrate-binding protein [Pseudonocardia sp. NPDC049154]|uniref:ABC transporter substrate-binding protein n=1 Tax=Pseudonocardia sp. NPDC049154 TaxID=3155501 RepID=UPI0033E405B0
MTLIGTRARLVAPLVGAALLLTACAGGGDTTESDHRTLTIRAIAAEGTGLTNYPDVDAGAKAAVQAINAAGGVNGKQIEYSFCNTKGEANGALTCARQAADDGVDAIVGRVDIYTTQTTPILEKAGIPDVGAVPIAEIDSQSPVSFPLHAGNYGAYAAGPYAFQAAGKKKMAIVRLDFAATAAQADMIEKVAAAAGMPSAGQIIVPAQGVTDYAPYAQQIKDRGADCAMVLLGPQGLQAVYKAADALGVDAQLAASVFSFGESEAQAIGPASDGIWVISPYGAPSQNATFNADLDSAGVAADDLALRRSAGLNAWLAVHAAADVAGGIQGDITAESMTAALRQAKAVDVEGVLTWDPADLGAASDGAFPRFPPTPFEVLTFSGGRMVPAGGAPKPDPLEAIR